jgi:hypothetical protein
MRRTTDFFVVHSSATRPGVDVGVKEIREWHTLPKPRGNGWMDIGYHFVIRRSGAIEAGRVVDEQGAHVGPTGNSRSVGICVVGGLNSDGKPEVTFTGAQYETLEILLRLLARIYPDAVVRGHRDFMATVCPGFDVQQWAKARGLPV